MALICPFFVLLPSPMSLPPSQMEEEVPSPAPPPEEPTPVVQSDSPPSESSTGIPDRIPSKRKRTKNKRGACPFPSTAAGPSGSTSSPTRIPYRRRSPRVTLGIGRRHVSEAEAIALPLGMSLAAVVAQVLERQDMVREKTSVDYLSQICTSAVRESLSNVFGDKFSGFVDNFDKSFGSTLRTLRLLNGSSAHRSVQASFGSTLRNLGLHNDSSSSQTAMGTPALEQGVGLCDSSIEDDREGTLQNFESVDDYPLHPVIHQEINSHAPLNQLACITRSKSGPVISQPMYSTFKKSVIEQTRSNDLKTLELSLSMKKMKLKEAELSLSYDANELERSKFALGMAKTSFKIEKFKTQVHDFRHAQLLEKCVDCLAAGLIIMCLSLGYGVYVFAYNNISESTASCDPLIKKSKSWWFIEPVTSFNTGFERLKCQALVLSRMFFGILLILASAYWLVQRSSNTNQKMPGTFLLLILGVFCGLVGKFCVDTLGGSGFHWVLIWEVICLVHFFVNAFTSVPILILLGPVEAATKPKGQAVIIPYQMRRMLFYTVVGVFLPVLCGLMPFGSTTEWKDHFLQKVRSWIVSHDGGLS